MTNSALLMWIGLRRIKRVVIISFTAGTGDKCSLWEYGTIFNNPYGTLRLNVILTLRFDAYIVVP